MDITREQIKNRLICAKRQFRHNMDNSGSLFDPEQGFVIAYDVDEVDQLIEDILGESVGSVQRVLMDDITDPNDTTVVIVTNWGAIPFIYEGDADVQQLIEKFNNPLQNDGSWALWSGEELKNCYDVSSRYL